MVFVIRFPDAYRRTDSKRLINIEPQYFLFSPSLASHFELFNINFLNKVETSQTFLSLFTDKCNGGKEIYPRLESNASHQLGRRGKRREPFAHHWVYSERKHRSGRTESLVFNFPASLSSCFFLVNGSGVVLILVNFVLPAVSGRAYREIASETLQSISIW